MRTEELLDLYPIATEVVRDWFMDKMAESFKNQELPKDFKEFMREQGIPNDKLVKLIDVNPRVLFDVFDDNGVIINVVHSNGVFSWDVNTVKSLDSYSSRREAESASVQRAFQILHDKLNVTLTEDDA
jgi:hypothetical protein